jgi:hypothetical protein
MKPSTSAALILCTVVICLTVCVCTGHTDVTEDFLWFCLLVFFFFLL